VFSLPLLSPGIQGYIVMLHSIMENSETLIFQDSVYVYSAIIVVSNSWSYSDVFLQRF